MALASSCQGLQLEQSFFARLLEERWTWVRGFVGNYQPKATSSGFHLPFNVLQVDGASMQPVHGLFELACTGGPKARHLLK